MCGPRLAALNARAALLHQEVRNQQQPAGEQQDQPEAPERLRRVAWCPPGYAAARCSRAYASSAALASAAPRCHCSPAAARWSAACACCAIGAAVGGVTCLIGRLLAVSTVQDIF